MGGVGVYLVQAGVPGPRGCTWSSGGYLVGGCTWSQGVYLVWGVYLVPGGCTWSKGGVPGREVYLVWGGIPGPGRCTWSQGVYLVRGVYLLPGGTWSGTPPPLVDGHTPVNILPCPKLRLRAVTMSPTEPFTLVRHHTQHPSVEPIKCVRRHANHVRSESWKSQPVTLFHTLVWYKPDQLSSDNLTAWVFRKEMEYEYKMLDVKLFDVTRGWLKVSCWRTHESVHVGMFYPLFI